MIAAFQVYAGDHNKHRERSHPKYVGDGHYTCHDKTFGCAMVKENNRRLTQEKIKSANRRDQSSYEPPSERADSSLFPSHEKGNYIPSIADLE